MSNLMKVSSNPHIRSKVTSGNIMLAVVIALLPAAGFGIYNFGLHALILICVTIMSCVATEFIYEKLMKKEVTIGDFSAVVTGLLLALNLPPMAPWWIGMIGGIFAILVVKMLFGGLGQNFMNPALGARCFLLISFTSIMTNFDCDAYTGATPLAQLKSGITPDVFSMVIGRTGGTIGETSMIAIVAGACILILLGIIDLKIPGSYIVSFVVFICLFGGHGPDPAYISAHLAGGGLMLGAFFMATDYVTSPTTDKGKLIAGIFLGVVTMLIRKFGTMNEGVSFAILLMNLVTPYIDALTRQDKLGIAKKKKEAAK